MEIRIKIHAKIQMYNKRTMNMQCEIKLRGKAMKKRIVLTGGGTAGHVTPNIALIPRLREHGYEVSYIGSYDGIEKKLIEDMGIAYYGISSGKLRRYLSMKNLSDPFRVLKGIHEAKQLMKKLNPDIVFSKGGFVAVPVVLAAKSRKIPVIIHESDMTPGLANKLAIPSAVKVCCNFPETISHLPKGKAVVTGSPIRRELLDGNKEAGRTFCGFDQKPVILIIGGSLGAVAINNAVRQILPDLLKNYNVIHLCGKGHLDSSLDALPGYVQYEYIKEELPDLFALADLVISRAGANAICELSALAKPNILIPLPAAASRGDQILNAESYKKQGYSLVLKQEDMTADTLKRAIYNLYENRDDFITAMKSGKQMDSIGTIVDLIEQYRRK
jgi:UDP-N-acetylglucosamine--N-acetylmuramyl-(pentapeptide) pyrophosphoryl-undecaprenol N-acetylglucosamine transferase